MKLTDYITLGKSGLKVSPITLGTMTFGEEWGWGSTPKDSEIILSRYIELGGNSIDTANIYTKGHSEKIIGDFIKNTPIRRDQLVIGSKFFGNLYLGDPNTGGASRKTILQSLENSLRRLQTDYLDIYWLHSFDENTPIEETLSTLNDLVRSGKVRYIAVSDSPAWKVAQAQTIANFRGWAPFIATQLEYSLLERSVEGELVPMSQELGLGIMPWSPLKQGVLTGKYTRDNVGTKQSERENSSLGQNPISENTFKIIDRLDELAKVKNTFTANIALAWVISRKGVSSTIIGARTLNQLNQNLSALNIDLSEDEVKYLDELSEPELNFPLPMLKNNAFNIAQAGTTVNGHTSLPLPFIPKNISELY